MRNIFKILKQIKETLGEDNEYSEIKAGIDDIEYSLGFKAPEDTWNYVYDRLIMKFIPPQTDIDYKVLSIWTTKTVEELKKENNMREIKFRGKLINSEKWAEGNLNVTKQGTAIITPDETVLGRYGRVIPETVGQFTGQYDKNRKEIYERRYS